MSESVVVANTSYAVEDAPPEECSTSTSKVVIPSSREAWREKASKEGLSQAAFCRIYRIDRSNFSKWLRNRRASPASEAAVLLYLQDGDTEKEEEETEISRTEEGLKALRYSTRKERPVSSHMTTSHSLTHLPTRDTSTS